MTEALRSVYADLGLSADVSPLLRADAAIDAVTAKLQRLVSGQGFSGTTLFDKLGAFVARGGQVTGALMDAMAADRDVQESTAKQVLNLHRAAVEELEKQNAALEHQASSAGQLVAAERQRLAFAKERLDHEQGQRARATPEGQRRAQDRFRMGAESARGDRAERRAWETSPEGQRAAALERVEAAADAARKPVTGLLDLLGRLQVRASTAIGQKLPQAFQKLSERVGIAKGDFAAMGQLAVGVTGSLLAMLHRGVSSAFEFASAFTETSEQLRETARQARVTSSELQGLQHAGTASGVGADRVTSSVTALGQKLRDANSHLAGSGSTVAMLRRLGIQARDSSGQVRPTVDILTDLSGALEHVSSPRRRIRIAESLGLDRRMLDILHTGTGGLQELMAEMEELGGGIQPEATEAAHRYALAQERLRVATTSLRSAFFTQLAPALEWVVQKGAKLAGWVSRMTRGSHFFQVGLVALAAVGVAAGAAVFAAWFPVVGPFLAAAAAGLVVAAVLDDIWGFLEGNNSALGYFLDELFGVGTAAEVVEDLAAAFEWVSDALRPVLALLRQAVAFLMRLQGNIVRSQVELVRTSVNGVARGLGMTDLLSENEGGAHEAPPPDPEAASRASRARRAMPRRTAMERRTAAAKSRSERAKASAPPPAAPSVVQLGLDGRPIGQTPAPARAATVTHQHRHEGNRTSIIINGGDLAAVRRTVVEAMTEAQRREADARHPTEAEE